MALRSAIQPLAIYTDHWGILDGIAKGKWWCIHPARPHAYVWWRIWHLWEEHKSGVQVEHCKAHQSLPAISQLEPIPKAIAEGNAEADKWATAGADLERAKGGGHQARREAADRVQ